MERRIHFPGLNGIRAIAALIVLIFHTDQFIRFFGLNSIGFHKTGMAGYGVILFFVLSGYLITYLLLIEKEEFTYIDLKKFYIRRILRIWPIYYIVILIAILIYFLDPNLILFPEDNILKTFVLYSFFLPNIGYSIGLGITTITPLWSVGVEEQFYAFWPFLLGKSKNIFKTLIILIFVYLLLKLTFRIFENGKIYNLIGISCFDCMAIGGVGAFLVYTKHKILKIIYNPIVQIISWATLLISVFHRPIHFLSLIDNEINSLFYIVIIINVSSNKETIVNLENKLFDFIGRISYGIYVYHVSVILGLSFIFKHLFKNKFTNNLLDYTIVFSTSIFMTLFISFLSYRFFESYFLRLKNKYSKIESVNKI